jgi:hypothetical protein
MVTSLTVVPPDTADCTGRARVTNREVGRLPGPSRLSGGVSGVRRNVRPGVRRDVCPGVRRDVCPGIRRDVCPGVRRDVCPGVRRDLSERPAGPVGLVSDDAKDDVRDDAKMAT